MSQRVLLLPPLPERPRDGHKGLFGKVLVLGGNAEMIGAPAFAGAAAFRMGAGLVQIGTPKAILPFSLAVEPELIGLALPTSAKRWAAVSASADALVVGPGLGQLPDAKKLLDAVLKLHKPVVIDADGLNLLSIGKRWPRAIAARCVLTPHPGEMKRLGRLFGKSDQSQSDDDRLDTAYRAAKAFKQIIVLKGARTIVTDGVRHYVNPTGDSSLSKAGTGDVLTGICATLLAQEVEPFDAACMSTWLHGRAGERAGEQVGPRSTTAQDVIDHIHQSIADYERTFGSAMSHSPT